MDPQLFQLATLGIEAVAAILVIRYSTNVIITRIKTAPKLKNNGQFQGFTALVMNVDTAIDQLHKQRQELLQRGVKEDQLVGIDRNLKYLEMVRGNKSWLQYIAPYVDTAADLGLKTLKRIL